MQSSQTAQISVVQGSAQVIRAGYFFPAEAGMVLEPGDRITSDAGSRVEVQFSGTDQNLIIRNGSAATLFQEVTQTGLAPQWVAGDLYGEQIYFAQAGEDNPEGHQAMDLYGLFGAGGGESTFPVVKTAAAAGLAALAINEANDDSSSSANNSAGVMGDTVNGGSSGNSSGSNSGSNSGSDSGNNASDGSSSGSDAATGDTGGGESSATPGGLLAGTPLADTPLGNLPLEAPTLPDGASSGLPLPLDQLPLNQLPLDALNEAPLTSTLANGLSGLEGLSTAGLGPLSGLPGGLPISSPTGSSISSLDLQGLVSDVTSLLTQPGNLG